MDERQPGSHRVIVIFAGLIALITGLALSVPYELRARQQVTASVVSGPTPASVPAVELWLSTADRRLKLAQQPDIPTRARGSDTADIVIDAHKTYQTMVGFGAAMTDSTAWLLQNKLDAARRHALLRELYGPPPGLNFNMMRLTIGASDFSLNLYTFDDIPFGDDDPDLSHFNVTPNMDGVIPTVREVLSINPDIAIVASSWSAPAWMKTNQNLLGGELEEKYESAYANYLVKYLDAFRSHGIPIFALTLQNEPAFQPLTYPGMLMPAATRARVIGQYLGPKLAKRVPRTQILDWDHNWNAPEQPLEVLGDPVAARYVDGVAWHCYQGSPYAQGRVHKAHPDKDAYLTECSGGDWASAANGELLWFSRDLLIAGIRQWARGVIYWNLALDENHGPHFGGCDACKGVVLIDSRTGEISRNDEYYALAHFSRFVLPDAVRIGSTDTGKGIHNVAFQNASDGSVVLVVVNGHAQAHKVSVAEGQIRFEYDMPAQSVATFVWNPDPHTAWLRRFLWWMKRVH